MKRRDFLQTTGMFAAAALLPGVARADTTFDPRPGPWRTFEVTTRIDVPEPAGTARVWVPIPSVNEPEWFRSLASEWSGNARKAEIAIDPKYGAAMVYAEWAAGNTSRTLEVVSRFSARDRAVDLGRPGNVGPLAANDAKLYTAPTELIPTDGLVRDTALKITRGAQTDLAKARAIYEWVVTNTFRDPKTRGCGLGNILVMLETMDLGGKCADLNALFVGLARAVGLPARDVYGIRVAPSQFGYKSLGAGSANITKAQHCRAEVYLTGYGWVPVDPADVRKVVLEEPPGQLALDNPKVAQARRGLFGAWETNWLAYNVAHDVKLPYSDGPALGFLMYPQAEIVSRRLDCLDPDNFRYQITAKEITA